MIRAYGYIVSSYWDVDTSCQETGSYKNRNATNITGLYSSADSLAAAASRKSVFAASSYNGWDMATDAPDTTKVWYIDDGHSYPLLSAFLMPMLIPVPEDSSSSSPPVLTSPAYIGAVGSAAQLASSGAFIGQRGGLAGPLYTIIDAGVNLDGQNLEQKQ